jgi:hypothetical protein
MKLAMSTLKLIKNGRTGVLLTMSSIYRMLSIFTKIEQQELQKRQKRAKNKEMSNIGP